MSFDGAKTCELVGYYLLSKCAPQTGNTIGLYRHEAPAAFNKKPREIEIIKKIKQSVKALLREFSYIRVRGEFF